MADIVARRSTASVALALTLVLTGCASDPDNDPESDRIAEQDSAAADEDSTTEPAAEPSEDATPSAPEVVESGFGVNDYGLGVIVSVIKNPSTTEGGYVTVSGTAYNAAGLVLGTSSGSQILRSGETSATADSVSVPEGSEIARVTVQAAFSQTEPDENPDSRITSRGVQVVADEYSVSANGELVSAYESDLTDALAVAVCRDAAGAIVGGGLTFVPLLPGGGTTGVSIDVTGPTAPNEPAACDIYANVSNLS